MSLVSPLLLLLLLDLERDLPLEIDLVFFEFFPAFFTSSDSSGLDSFDSENFFGTFFLPIDVNFFFFAGAFLWDGWAAGVFSSVSELTFFFY